MKESHQELGGQSNIGGLQLHRNIAAAAVRAATIAGAAFGVAGVDIRRQKRGGLEEFGR